MIRIGKMVRERSYFTFLAVVIPVGVNDVEICLANSREQGYLPKNSFNPRARHYDFNSATLTVLYRRVKYDGDLLRLESIV